MATFGQRARSLERLERLSRSTQDGESIQREVIADLRRVIGFDRWCWPLADPDTLIPVAALAEHDYLPALARLLELEYSVDDFAAKPVLAHSEHPAASLRGATDGDLARSARWDQVMRPVGIGDVGAAACRDALGVWGWIEAYRDRDDPDFTEDEIDLLGSVGQLLGPTLRQKGTYAAPGGYVDARQPGVMVIDASMQVRAQTPGTHAWLDALPPARLFSLFGILPAHIYPVAVRARAGHPSPFAMVRAEDDSWVMIEAAPFEGQHDDEVVVTFRSPTAAEMVRLLARVHALTQRETDLVKLLIAGLDTRAVSERLLISPLTVQDHLKAIFAKTAVHSRRELLARFAAFAA